MTEGVMQINYRKAKGTEIHCRDCQSANVRQESGRLECLKTLGPYVVGANHTCDAAKEFKPLALDCEK